MIISIVLLGAAAGSPVAGGPGRSRIEEALVGQKVLAMMSLPSTSRGDTLQAELSRASEGVEWRTSCDVNRYPENLMVVGFGFEAGTVVTLTNVYATDCGAQVHPTAQLLWMTGESILKSCAGAARARSSS